MTTSLLTNKSVIAAVRRTHEFELALDSPVRTVFLMSSDILSLKKRLSEAKSHNKKIFVHLDFCDGISKDKYGLGVLKQIGAEGIISTRTNLIISAKELGLLTIQRFFIIDSSSINYILNSVKNDAPDFIEIMPGIMPSVVKEIADKLTIPLIAGGLIQTREQAVLAIESGAKAISTSCMTLWNLCDA